MADNKEYISSVEEQGSVNISEDVIAAIAAAAVMEVDGMNGFAASFGSDIAGFIGKKGSAKGIRISIEEGRITVDTFVLICYGAAISDVAKQIQSAVASAIESMTNIAVAAVNVHVCGVAFEKGK